MSDGGPETREWRFHGDDMIGIARKVLSYTAGLDQAAFVADDRTYDATLRNLELICEAASRIPDAARAAHPDIPWRLIVATRNRPDMPKVGAKIKTWYLRGNSTYKTRPHAPPFGHGPPSLF